jgi:hypothetical protein
MKNIAVALSDRAYHAARVWAARRDTSLSKIVQDFLESLPRIRSARGGMERTSKSLLERPRSLKGLACEIERRTYPCETVNL